VLVSVASRDIPRAFGEPCEGIFAPDATCPVCEAGAISTHRNNLSRCQRCRHIFQTDLRVSTVYDATYAHRYDARPHREMSALRWDFVRRWVPLRPGGRILDIGYGNGSFLKHARRHGMEVYGLDVHGEDFGVPTVAYDTPLAFDLVCFFDSLEHLPRFASLFALRAAHVIVSLPAVPAFLLETPLRWRHYKPGEHLHYFSCESLDMLMRRWRLPVKLAAGVPEDAMRGKLTIGGRVYDNIHTAIYGGAIHGGAIHGGAIHGGSPRR
jgi:SAM-dependent methyltransferase